MKTNITQFLFGIGLLTALVAHQSCQRMTEPETVADLIGNCHAFRLDFGGERWLNASAGTPAFAFDYFGPQTAPYGFDVNGDGQVDYSDLNELVTWFGGALPVNLPLSTGFGLVFTASTQAVITNLAPITIQSLTIPTGTTWTLSKTLNDEGEDTQDCCFRTFFVEPQIGGVKPRWYYHSNN